MTSSITAQIQAFRDEVVDPAFLDFKTEIENSETNVVIIESTKSTTDAIDAVLRRMHPETLYLGSTISPSASSQTWIVASVYVEVLQNSELDAACLGQYCLSIEIETAPTAQIQVALIVGYGKGKGNQLTPERNVIKADQQPIAFEDIDCFDLFERFIKSFEGFEHHLSEPELAPIEAPTDLKTDLALDLYVNEPSLTPPEASPLIPESQQPEPTPFIDLQILYDLSKQLTQTLAPQGFPIYSKFNPKLFTPAQIKPVQDRYGRTIDLSLEYSQAVTEAELSEHLHRLGHYQTLKHLAHLHTFIQDQMQAWHKQHGQPSVGAIAPHLQQQIIELRDHLYRRIQTLTDSQLDSTAQALNHETEALAIQQQQQQTLLDQLEQNPLLGYLDIRLLNSTNPLKEPIQPFTDLTQPINISAKHYKAKNSKSILSHIASCQSEKYSAYRQRKPDHPELKPVIEYAITQKLYPQRTIFIGFAPKAIHPRLELLWGQTDGSFLNPSPLHQIWCIYPMMRTDPPQWLIIAATTDTQALRSIPLENGQVAEEGTLAYLERSLYLMTQSEEEYAQVLSHRVTEAIAHKRIKYLHIHQTQDSQTDTPRDILQMQFQLFG